MQSQPCIKHAVVAILCLAALLPLPGLAQQYPNKGIRVVVPFTPGSASDILARIVGQKLNVRLGQPIIVDNRPGAGGTIGTHLVAKSRPDGYTLAVVSAGHVVNSVLYVNLPYDPVRDFSGVIPLASLPSVLTITPSMGVKSVREFIAAAKAKPGQFNYASGGVGSGSHVNAEKFRIAAGIEAVHIPLKGAPEMITEMIGDRIHFGFTPIIATLQMVKEGKLTALAVSSAKRSAALPQVPTIAEAGLPQAEFNFWIAMLAPAKTPPEIVAKLNGEIAKIVALAEVSEQFSRLGAEPMVMTPQAFNVFLKSESASLGAIMREAGVKTK